MINQFKGEYRWLSNFPDCIVYFEGDCYRSVEVAYQAAKSLNPEVRMMLKSKSSAEAKKLIKDFEIRENWGEVKLEVMRSLLLQKFKKPRFRKLLLETGDAQIVEGNWWGDKYWGVCLKTSEGENNLGKLIMKIREDLKNDKTDSL